MKKMWTTLLKLINIQVIVCYSDVRMNMKAFLIKNLLILDRKYTDIICTFKYQ
jgi:hypothetical protein